MEMTKDQIVQEYKQAKNKKKQIQILADLNTCSQDTILQILKDSGKVKQQELPRPSKVKAKAEIPVEPQQGEMNDLEKAMSELITELKGENDSLKGRVQELEDLVGGYDILETDLNIKLQAAQDRVKQLEDELADTRSALESTEKQLDDELANARGYVEHCAETEARLRSTIDKLTENERELKEQIEKQARVIERMASAISDHSAQSAKDQEERRRSSDIMMGLIQKFVLN